MVDLETQLEQFKELGVLLKKELGLQQAHETISNAVYLFSVGGNDLMSQYNTSTDLSYESSVDMVIGNVTGVIEVGMFKFSLPFTRQ